MFTISAWTFTESVSCGVCETDLGGNNLEEVCLYPKILNMTTPNKSSVAKLGTVPMQSAHVAVSVPGIQ